MGGYAIGSWASESLSESMFEMAVIRLSPLHCGFSYGETGRTERRSDIARFPGTCTDGISPTRSARAIWGGGEYQPRIGGRPPRKPVSGKGCKFAPMPPPSRESGLWRMYLFEEGGPLTDLTRIRLTHRLPPKCVA